MVVLNCKKCFLPVVEDAWTNLTAYEFSKTCLLGFPIKIIDIPELKEHGRKWLHCVVCENNVSITDFGRRIRTTGRIILEVDERVVVYATLKCIKCGSNLGYIDRSVIASGVAIFYFKSFSVGENFFNWNEIPNFTTQIKSRVHMLSAYKTSPLFQRIDLLLLDQYRRDRLGVEIIKSDPELENIDDFIFSEKINSLTKTKPRSAQQSLYVDAISHDSNCLITLPTGYGKTLVAIMLARRILELNPEMQVLFVTETVALASQQASEFRRELGVEYPVELLVGDILEFPSLATLHERALLYSVKFLQAKVIVATAGAFYQACEVLKIVAIQKLCAIILDEAHHCDKNHPFKQKIVDYCYVQVKHFPKIIGLTAFPGAARTPVDTVNEIKVLLGNLHDARILFPSLDIDLAELNNVADGTPLKLVETCRNREETELFEALFNFIMRLLKLDTVANIGAKKPAISTLLSFIQEKFGVSGSSLCSVNLFSLFNAMVAVEELGGRKTWEALEDLDSSGKKWRNVDFEVHRLLQEQLLLEQNFDGSAYSQIRNLILTELNRNRQEFSCLIFVSRRDIAKFTVDCIEKDPSIKNVVVDYIVGQSEMNLKKQQEVLEKMRNREIDILVSTTVCNEGVDFPHCNLVICSTLPSSTLSFVQVRGRVRAAMRKGGSKTSNFYGIKRTNEADKMLERFEHNERMMYTVLAKITTDGRFHESDIITPADAQFIAESPPTVSEVQEQTMNCVGKLNEYLQKQKLLHLLHNRTEVFGMGFSCVLTLKTMNGEKVAQGFGLTKKAAKEDSAKLLLQLLNQ